MSEKESSISNIKVFALGILLLAAVGYIYATYSYWTTGGGDDRVAVADPAFRPDRPAAQIRGGGGERPNPGEIRQRLVQELNLTEAQQKQMEEIRTRMESGGNRGPGGMMAEMREVLTPEQQEKAREMFAERGGRFQEMAARREEEARNTLSPEDFKVWQEKQAEFRDRMRQRAAEGGFRGPRGEGGERRGGNSQ